MMRALFMLYASLLMTTAQAQTVSLQAAMNDSTFLKVRLGYSTAGKGTLTLKNAYLTRRGQLKRMPVECKELHYQFERQSPPSFLFSMNVSHEGRRYRVHGSYSEAGGVPDCSLRCVPLRLSDKTLRESEYP